MLLQHAFICRDIDAKPVKDLLLEYRAEVVEEVVDEETEVNINIIDFVLYNIGYYMIYIIRRKWRKSILS